MANLSEDPNYVDLNFERNDQVVYRNQGQRQVRENDRVTFYADGNKIGTIEYLRRVNGVLVAVLKADNEPNLYLGPVSHTEKVPVAAGAGQNGGATRKNRVQRKGRTQRKRTQRKRSRSQRN